MTLGDHNNLGRSEEFKKITPPEAVLGAYGVHKERTDRTQNVEYAFNLALFLETRIFSGILSTMISGLLYFGYALAILPSVTLQAFEEHRAQANIAVTDLSVFVARDYQAMMHVDDADHSVFSAGAVFSLDRDGTKTQGGDLVYGSHGFLLELRSNMVWTWKAQSLPHCTARMNINKEFPRFTLAFALNKYTVINVIRDVKARISSGLTDASGL
ncbi:hypothetical protein M427DRAFT_137864 [Gonapodya prolifera JEL478]|uniref:Uncharacterized protein n=1 Tax=Gonapodya prolifera (strain JEL478) TaxID=1344416 RepID=A0A139A5M5_GONPJ|nr:hypothetical protein M427DRAFT_137864 [Gonapodya prolifera JEL478]|eukprot:KXS11775.1 hypothetical protein M427DRAFT_137864 [Gonapodya prolifera JEL478]